MTEQLDVSTEFSKPDTLIALDTSVVDEWGILLDWVKTHRTDACRHVSPGHLVNLMLSAIDTGMFTVYNHWSHEERVRESQADAYKEHADVSLNPEFLSEQNTGQDETLDNNCFGVCLMCHRVHYDKPESPEFFKCGSCPGYKRLGE